MIDAIMKNILRIVALVAATVCGCGQTTVAPCAPPSRFAIDATIGDGTRTTLGGKTQNEYAVHWDDADRIAVNGCVSDFVHIDSRDARRASFSFAVAPSAPYRAICPASAVIGEDVVLPATQIYRKGSFPAGYDVMLGGGDGSSLSFDHACGFVKVSLRAAVSGENRIKSIRLSGNCDEQVAGCFGIDWDARKLVPAGDGRSVTLVCDGVKLSDEPTDFIIALPAQTFEKGFTIEIDNVAGHRQVRKTTKRIAVEAGCMAAMSEFRFAPAQTVVEAVAAAAAPTSIYALNTREEPLNSHADETDFSILEADRRSFRYLDPDFLTINGANYPRLKRCADGRYLLIYQQKPQSAVVFWTMSDDMCNWEPPQKLFSPYKITNGGGEKDWRYFSSTDALVLQNGDILAFTSYRAVNGYRFYDGDNGIVMKRSTDNGRTWSEEQTIFVGSTWEPYALQLPSGEIHVYFTHCIPIVGDSGTSLLRSADNGRTWTSQCKIIRQLGGETRDGTDTPVYTDQMPVARLLNGTNKVAVALESRFKINGVDNNLWISMAWSDDNWSKTLTGSETGPAERHSNMFRGGGPYLMQFPSGETLLSYNIGNIFRTRIGNPQASNFADRPAYAPFGDLDRGCWGMLEPLGSHVAGMVFVAGLAYDGSDGNRLMIQRAILNHRIDAARLVPMIDGGSDDWSENTDALFMGSESLAQTVFRFAHNDDYLYLLVEKSDDEVRAGDRLELKLHSGVGSARPYVLTFTVDAAAVGIETNKTDITVASRIVRTEKDAGVVIEVAIPKSKLSFADGRIRFNAVMTDGGTIDTWDGLTEKNYSEWLPVRLADR